MCGHVCRTWCEHLDVCTRVRAYVCKCERMCVYERVCVYACANVCVRTCACVYLGVELECELVRVCMKEWVCVSV
jgi:hypothetical protein